MDNRKLKKIIAEEIRIALNEMENESQSPKQRLESLRGLLKLAVDELEKCDEMLFNMPNLSPSGFEYDFVEIHEMALEPESAVKRLLNHMNMSPEEKRNHIFWNRTNRDYVNKINTERD